MKVTDKHDCKVVRKFQVGGFFVKISGRFFHRSGETDQNHEE